MKAKIRQILPAPVPIKAVYEGGYQEPVLLIALDSKGNIFFLSADDQGEFWKPDEVPGFSHYSF